MKKILLLFFFLLLGTKSVCYANQDQTEAIVYEVKKEVVPLPSCEDKELLAKAKEFITAYFNKSDNQNIMFRRRKHFILNNFDKFTKENIANYKTVATRPVSDIIADLKINENIIEENMLLCKKQTKDKISKDLYLLVYPDKANYTVRIINLDRQNPNEKNTFVY